jgi:hypothetical protein
MRAGAEPDTAAMHRLIVWLLGTGESIAGAVYGAIVVLATLSAASADGAPGSWELAVTVIVTTFILGLAHLYSETVAATIVAQRPLTSGERLAIRRRELAIPAAATPPVLVLVAGAAGVLAEDTAFWVAVAMTLVTLLVQGLRLARIEHLGTARSLLTIGGTLGLGLAIVALEVATGH